MALLTTRLLRVMLGLACFVAVLLPSPIFATIMLPLSIEDMAGQSASIVRGRVVGSHADWDSEHQRIYTYTELEVLDPIHTDAKLPTTVVVRTLGGEVGKIGMKVSGTEKFSVNEEVLVFLRHDPIERNMFQVVGMSQGKYHIEHEAKGRAVAVPSVEGLAFAKPDATGTLKVDPDTQLPDRFPLADLRQRILAAIAEHRTPEPTGQGALSPPPLPGAPQTGTSPAVDHR